jgi:hypothetical protein
MAKITVDIPDELSEQLTKTGENPSDWLSQRLPQLMALNLQQTVLPAQIYHYILNFIANNPSPQQIADFRPTPDMLERLQTLLSRSQAGKITPVEQTELEEYERIEHLIIMLKSGNLRYLNKSERLL